MDRWKTKERLTTTGQLSSVDLIKKFAKLSSSSCWYCPRNCKQEGIRERISKLIAHLEMHVHSDHLAFYPAQASFCFSLYLPLLLGHATLGGCNSSTRDEGKTVIPFSFGNQSIDQVSPTRVRHRDRRSSADCHAAGADNGEFQHGKLMRWSKEIGLKWNGMEEDPFIIIIRDNRRALWHC